MSTEKPSNKLEVGVRKDIREEAKFSVEDAITEIDKTLDSAENKFFEKYGKYPDLYTEEDYVNLAQFLDVKEEAFKNYFRLYSEDKDFVKSHRKQFSYSEEGDNIYRLPKIPFSAYCFRLMRRFLERQDFFKGEHQKIFFDAILGVNEWCKNPERVRDFRLASIEKLRELGLGFPKDFGEFLSALDKIGSASILNGIYAKDKQSFRTASDHIGNQMVNPARNTAGFLSRISDFDDLYKLVSSYETERRSNYR